MKKLLPILLVILGIGGGAGAGLMLRPKPEPIVIDPCGDGQAAEDHAAAPAPAAPEEPEEDASREYLKMHNQFIVPVVTADKVSALVVISISLETQPGVSEQVFAREPKLRDSFLQVMFDHANIGGFEGAFTNANNLDMLRGALLNVARRALGPIVTDVLITDIARQDS